MPPDDNPERWPPPDVENGETAKPAGAEPPGRLPDLASEWLDHALYYAEARADEIRVAAKHAVRDAAWELALQVGVSLVMGTGVVLVFVGLALGLGRCLGDRPWAGWMISGALLVVLCTAGLAWYNGRLEQQDLDRARHKYEQRRAQQQDRFGHTVVDRARDGGGAANEKRTGISP